MQNRDFVVVFKRIPAVAEARQSLARALRSIRRMNPPVAIYALQHIRKERQDAVKILFAPDSANPANPAPTLDLHESY